MKKTSSFNLEQDTWNEIIAYKNKFNLSSRNVALERMLLERRILLNSNKPSIVKPIINVKTNPDEDRLLRIINSIMSNMSD
jgi:hypothetical protein